jgi:cytosine/adenosine deaminase-related metal-dependent hydrolase
VDLFEEARCVERHERLARQVRGTHRVADLLAALTTRGHDSLGWPDGGRLTVGEAADLVTVDLTSVRTAGCGGDPEVALAAAVYAATASDVRHVVAGGRVVVSDGTHRSLDVARELSNAVAAVREAGR